MTTLLRRGAAILAATGCLILLAAGPAAAHVTIDTAEPAGGGAARVTFTFNHACADSPTTELAVTMPMGTSVETVSPPPGWDSAIDGDTVTMTGPAIPGDRQTAYAITARLVGQVGRPLLFPTVQTCANGDTLNWTDPDEDSDEPAPRLIATVAVLDRIVAAPADIDKGDGASPVQIAVAIAVFVALAAAIAAVLTRGRHRITE